MRIAITGSSGLIGSALVGALSSDGHDITRIVRQAGQAVPATSRLHWDPVAGTIDSAALESYDAVIHLAGESVAGRWTRGKKARIRESRSRGTLLLSQALAGLERPPPILLSASAVGYYGVRPPAEPIDEDSAPGSGFLADTVVAWEAATRPAEEAGIRVVHLRFGMVLSTRGGALATMLPLFRLGLGGRFGNGEQIMSWISLAEIPAIVRHLLREDGPAGPVNVVSPNPVSNAEFTATLGRILDRPTLFHVPAFAARLALGEMADEMLLGGARVLPRRLLESGYRFAEPELEPAVRHALAEPR